MKLNNLIIILFIFVGIISSLAGGYFYYTNFLNLLEDRVSDDFLSISESRAEHIETYLKQNIEKLKLITSRNALRITLKDYNLNPSQDKIDTMENIITAAKESVEEIERVCVIGLDGIIITSTNEKFCGEDVSVKHFFEQGLQGEVISFVEEDGEIKLFVTGPFILNEETIGVGITVINSETFRKIIIDKTGLGETGEVLVAVYEDQKVVFLFERRFEEEALLSLESSGIAEPMKQALLGNELVFRNAQDYRNKPVVAASQYIKLVDLGLVAKIDREEIIGSYQRVLFLNFIYISLAIIIFSILIGWLVLMKFSKPINELTNKVNAISKGELNVQLSKSNIFEIDNLTNSLNRILASLKLAILRTGVTKGELGLGEVLKAKKEAETKASERLEQLERFTKLSEDRELKMIELKKKIVMLEKKVGK